MFVTVIAPKYALLASRWSCGYFLKLADSILFEWHDKSSPFNATHYIALNPQNGDRIVTTDSVTSLSPCVSTCRWAAAESRPDSTCVVSRRLAWSTCSSRSSVCWRRCTSASRSRSHSDNTRRTVASSSWRTRPQQRQRVCSTNKTRMPVIAASPSAVVGQAVNQQSNRNHQEQEERRGVRFRCQRHG